MKNGVVATQNIKFIMASIEAQETEKEVDRETFIGLHARTEDIAHLFDFFSPPQGQDYNNLISH